MRARPSTGPSTLFSAAGRTMRLDPSSMPHLQVQATDVPGVWHVRLPHWPWQYARAEEEREALVRQIADVAPVRRLWLSDSPDDTHGQWLTLSPDQTLGERRRRGPVLRRLAAAVLRSRARAGCAASRAGLPEDARRGAPGARDLRRRRGDLVVARRRRVAGGDRGSALMLRHRYRGMMVGGCGVTFMAAILGLSGRSSGQSERVLAP